MHAPILLTIAAILATSIQAAPLTGSDPPLRIRDLTIAADTSEDGNTTISFTVHDPSKYGKAATQCHGEWRTGSNSYPQGSYEPCEDGSFAWNMQSFTNIYWFRLGLEHQFEDPRLGNYPYDIVDNFAAADVCTSETQCANVGQMHTCHQSAQNVILAPVFASIAKRT